MPNRNTPESFWAKVDRSGGADACWLWTGAIHPATGYGQLRYQRVMRKAHRLAYELTNGAVPDGLELDHLCRNRGCVNPSHLEAVTHQINIQRVFEQRTHCKFGHELTPENVMVEPSSGFRRCRICRSEQLRLGKERRRRAKGMNIGTAGMANGRAKLTDGQARVIKSSTLPAKDLAAEYGVSLTTIYWIRKGKQWAATI